MQIWRDTGDVPADLGRSVVVIGNFDGVHLGHRRVIARAREIADERGLQVVAVTFDPHPMAVLRPDHAPITLSSIEERAELLAQAGADDVLALPFTTDVAALVARGVRRPDPGRPAARRRRRRGRELPVRSPGRRRRGPADLGRAWSATSRPRASPSTAARWCGRRRTSAPAWPPATSPAPPRRWAVRSPSAASSYAATSAVASSASPRPTCPRRGRPRRPPTACTPGGCAGSTPASATPRRSASAPTRRSTGTASAGSRATCWTATTWSSTTSRSRWSSSSGCAAWSGSTRSRSSSPRSRTTSARTRELLAA